MSGHENIGVLRALVAHNPSVQGAVCTLLKHDSSAARHSIEQFFADKGYEGITVKAGSIIYDNSADASVLNAQDLGIAAYCGQSGHSSKAIKGHSPAG